MKRWILLIVCAVLWLGYAPLAMAHAFLDHADPKVGSKVAQSPTTVEVWFTDDLDASGCSLQVLDASGHQVDKADCHIDPKDKSALIISVNNLSAGTYKVVWHGSMRRRTQDKRRFQIRRRPVRLAPQAPRTMYALMPNRRAIDSIAIAG